MIVQAVKDLCDQGVGTSTEMPLKIWIFICLHALSFRAVGNHLTNICVPHIYQTLIGPRDIKLNKKIIAFK